MEFNITEFLSGTFMFNSVKSENIIRILSDITYEFKVFNPKETIFSPAEYEHKLGFVVDGECSVSKLKSDNTLIPLNSLKTGDSFGILAVLANENEYPTCITALKPTKVLFISKNDVISTIKKYPTIAINVINFLSKKVVFLNRKLSTFSSDSVEQKLASFLYHRYKNDNETEFDFNCKKSAEAMNIGRASLYRAVAALEDAGIITLKNKKINIYDLEGLERISK